MPMEAPGTTSNHCGNLVETVSTFAVESPSSHVYEEPMPGYVEPRDVMVALGLSPALAGVASNVNVTGSGPGAATNVVVRPRLNAPSASAAAPAKTANATTPATTR